MRLAAERGPDEVDHERADTGADERHADEVGGHENQRADDPADDGRHDHPHRLIGPHDRAREQRAQHEPEEPEDDAEDAVAGKAGHQPAEDQDDGCGRLE